MSDKATRAGRLFVVATPIGNLEDMSARGLRVLREVGLIAAEDTRHSGRLLQHFAINKPFLSYHQHNEREQTERLLARLREGVDVALVSDAGTPLLSDPGFHLVRAAKAEGLDVLPIPGPCALVAALSASGLPSDRFVFEGFLPAKGTARRARLEMLREESRTLIFYEAPHRLLDTVGDMVAVFGAQREMVLARELTKSFETIRALPLSRMAEWIATDSDQQRGESVLLLAGWQAPEESAALPAEASRVLDLLLVELPVRRAAALASEITGLRKNLLYREALARSADRK